MDVLFALVYWLSLLFHYDYYFYVLLGLSVLYLFRAGADKRVLIASVALVIVLVLVAKPFLLEPRPCMTNPGLVACPDDNGFPSAHAAASFIIALNALGLAGFPFFFGAALFVSFSRVFLGVHSPTQVVAGIALATVVYLLVIEVRDKLDGKVKK
ncbi:MAG: phosphatase PAP2 family protein [Candidatus Micrarchaeota archaeon]